MSDPSSTDNVKRESAPRSVLYGLEIVDDLPDPLPIVRHSPLEDNLEAIVADAKYHDKWVRIGEYDKATAAGASCNVLRQRHGGNPTVEGFLFQAKRFNKDENGTQVPKTGLFVKFNPAAIVPGASEEWDRKELERVNRINEKRAAESKPLLPLPKRALDAKVAAKNGSAESPKPQNPTQAQAPGAGPGATSKEQAAAVKK